MKKLVLAFTLMSFLYACIDTDQEPEPDELAVTARVNSDRLTIDQEDGVNYAKVNGSMQVNALNFNDRGFKFFLGQNFESGSYDLSGNDVSVIYTDGINNNYKLRTGILSVTEYQETLLMMKGTFSGIAVNQTNQSDTVEISEGRINLDFN
ncbi:hypothetical protein GYB22_06280 [bacterium]|nr:hypothetical protein [bacterium]